MVTETEHAPEMEKDLVTDIGKNGWNAVVQRLLRAEQRNPFELAVIKTKGSLLT